mgnify:FL=1
MTADESDRLYRSLMRLLEWPVLENLEDADQLLHQLIDERKRKRSPQAR